LIGRFLNDRLPVCEIEKAAPSVDLGSALDAIEVARPFSWVSPLGGTVGLTALGTNENRAVGRLLGMPGFQSITSLG
jgi:hypothetical protein